MWRICYQQPTGPNYCWFISFLEYFPHDAVKYKIYLLVYLNPTSIEKSTFFERKLNNELERFTLLEKLIHNL